MICAETRWTGSPSGCGSTRQGMNISRMSTAESSLHHRVIFNSPLWRRDYIKTPASPDPTPEQVKEMEDNFVLDCITVEKKRYKWSPDIIPKYDALHDHYAHAYFRSPLVQSVLKKTLWGQRNKSIQGDESQTSINPLPGRRRLPRPPTADQLKEKRDEFILDSVVATNAVTQYPFRPLVPQYNSLNDSHSMNYLRKKGVRTLMARTMPEELTARAMLRKHRAKVGARLMAQSSIGSWSQVPATNTCTLETTPPMLPKLVTQKIK